jgi:hypothetical protein
MSKCLQTYFHGLNKKLPYGFLSFLVGQLSYFLLITFLRSGNNMCSSRNHRCYQQPRNAPRNDYHRYSASTYQRQPEPRPPCSKCGIQGHYVNYCPRDAILAQADIGKVKRGKKHKKYDTDISVSSSSESSSSSEEARRNGVKMHTRKKLRKLLQERTLDALINSSCRMK